MPLSLRQLHIFCAITQHGTTTRAGLALSLSQSATSAALNELESALGTKLFDRVGKRLVLNDNGHALLPQAIRLLENARQIEDSFQTENADSILRLKVGCSTTIGNYIMPAILSELHKTSPRLKVDVEMGNSAVIARKALQLEIDIGLIEGPCHLTELVVQPWLEDELLIVTASEGPLANKAHATIETLRMADWLLREPGSGTAEEVEQLLMGHLHDLRSTRQIGSSEAIKRMVALGLGVSCLSRWVVSDQLNNGQLCVIDSVLPPLKRHFYHVHHREKFMSTGLRQFMEICEKFRMEHSMAPLLKD